MEMEELEITIPRDGTVTVNVKGVKGRRCLDVTKGIEQAAGSVTARTFAASYYEQDVHDKFRVTSSERNTDL